ncbi:MAG: NAD(+) synthase [Clostridia bacterium]|nr:NAD(+) synthase [Clostridia bacterium]
MKDGFIKIAAVTTPIEVANCALNAQNVASRALEAASNGAKVIVFPELCLTGYTSNDLFLQRTLLNGVKNALRFILQQTAATDALIFVGAPIEYKNSLYNCAIALKGGKIIGVVPKKYLPNYSEYYELRHFAPAPDEMCEITLCGFTVPFGCRILFECENMPNLMVAAELCEDLWAPLPPSTYHALAGATLIVNLSAGDELVGKSEYRTELVRNQSARLIAAYAYASAGDGESTTDMVFAGHNMICENGTLLSQTKRFTTDTCYAEIDVERLSEERRRHTTFDTITTGYTRVPFAFDKIEETQLTRTFYPHPFVPADPAHLAERCEEILTIQACGLKKRLLHTRSKCAVIGLSGGLDSTLALLVTIKAFDLANLPRKGIIAVTMPCFGTTARTHNNAQILAQALGVTFEEINIENAVKLHFFDIGQDERVHDVTYENCQARERTQVLMDVANKNNGLVIGTGDLSEFAMGWATYNGDHMSMYAVNASVPKTLVRHLVAYYASVSDASLAACLSDILQTPVSPELLPPKDGEISQATEDIIGPYELHDFFLYYMLRFGFTPKKLFRLACRAFPSYDSATIKKWLSAFTRRFFASQFKRSCIPDGPKVGSVAISPRGDWRMPSDASFALWQKELDEIEV